MPISLLQQFFVITLISTIISMTDMSDAYKICLDEQKTQLLELKNNLTFNSAASRKLVQWNRVDDCCEWEGVECDASGHVISLQLDYEGVSGGIENSSSLVSLKYLEKLNLAHNSLNGSLPCSLFNLPSLKQLILSSNEFSGHVDDLTTPDLSILVELDLSYNRLEGSVPDSFFNLESLEVLSLSNNLFNRSLELKKIQRLHNLTTLNLSHNNLSIVASSLDSSLSGVSQLKKLSLASCNLHKFPDFIRQSNLSFLDLSENQITGEIPSWIWEIGNGALYHLNLSYNLLVDLQKPYHIPSFLAELDLHSNLLQGELPLLPQGASYVDFSDNKFNKPIPIDFVNSNPFLIFLHVANNTISGSIPASICSAASIQVLDFSLNNLSGSIPPCVVESISNLQALNVRSNNIGGDIPDKFPSGCGLRILDLSNNSLGGNFPESLANCASLEFLNVGENYNIGGSFPCMLSSRLRVLVLRANRFQGEVKCGESWTNLQIIDASANNFSGDLHRISFSSWKKMASDRDALALWRRTSLDINVVRPDFYYLTEATIILKGWKYRVMRLGFLRSLDLSSNNFRGEIPDAIGDLRSLPYLNLSHNALTGIIPKSLGNMEDLESLDLSVNQLTGTIPMELGGLTFLSTLNLSYNKLVGNIPSGRQLQTFTDDSFKGNPGLCLNRSCSNTDSNGSSPPEHENVEPKEIEWEYVWAAVGFVVGLGSIVWLLLCCRSFREKYFDKIEDVVEQRLYGMSRRRRHARRLVRTRGRR